MSLIDTYHKELEAKGYNKDPAQQHAIEALAQLQRNISSHLTQKNTFRYKLKSIFNQNQNIQGCYIWGDVGRGKTWIMDMFFDSFEDSTLLGDKKIRLHFHHFMQAIHDQLSLISEQRKPLKFIAKAFAKRYQLLCLDEFHVSDITDAMLLYGLLETLLSEGMILVITSNQTPDNLYKNGLQRERFLPAIELIKQHNQIIHLDGNTDHRLRLLEKADTWHLMSEFSQSTLESIFKDLAVSPAQRHFKIHINYRSIETLLYANDIIWFDFKHLCGDTRGSADYIEIAKQFHTVFISNIPIMSDNENDKAKRFINMIDEFYDRNVNLIVSAESKPDSLYSGKQFSFEFKRTVSRLQEMRSHEYMQRPHKIS